MTETKTVEDQNCLKTGICDAPEDNLDIGEKRNFEFEEPQPEKSFWTSLFEVIGEIAEAID